MHVNEDFKENQRSKFKIFILSVKSLLPFLLAHHPQCEDFEGHTLKIGKYRFCIGCFIGYPTAILSIIIIDKFGLLYLLPSRAFFFFGIGLIATFILSPLHITKIKTIKILQKILIGVGSGFLFWFLLILPNPLLINYFLILIVFSVILGVLNFHHAYSFYSGCKKCEYALNWGVCPGFKKIRDNLEKNNLKNIFLDLAPYSERIKQKRLGKAQKSKEY
ncbi:MAG: hypothetical protein ACTSR8_21440 [Promethearchaeota archaeon]